MPNRLIRLVLIVAGSLSLGLGILGIFVPLLPTTPFLLLAAACYAKSSKRFHNWLLSNRWFGDYLKDYQKERKIPLRAKILSIFLLWTTILFSVIFAIDIIYVRMVLILIAIGVTVHILSIRTSEQ